MAEILRPTPIVRAMALEPHHDQHVGKQRHRHKHKKHSSGAFKPVRDSTIILLVLLALIGLVVFVLVNLIPPAMHFVRIQFGL